MNHKSFSRCINSITTSEVVVFKKIYRKIERTANLKEITCIILSDHEIDLDKNTILVTTRRKAKD